MEPSPAPEITNSAPPPAGLLLLSLPNEEWRSGPHLDFRYWISSLGRIASTQYRGKLGCLGIITPALDGSGYLRTMLFLQGRYRTVKMHRLVVETWVGPIPPGMTVNHKDFSRANNAVSNLEVLTLKDNVRHSSRVGRYGKSKGSINGNSVLNETQVVEIRRRYAAGGVLQRELAVEFNVSRMTMGRVLRGLAWKHVS